MTQRFYFDTSIFGGAFDKEFEEETLLLFEKVKLGQIICVYSNLTESELINAPEHVRTFFHQLDSKYLERVEVTAEGYQLAQNYINEKIVGKTSLDDCIHIATATVKS